MKRKITLSILTALVLCIVLVSLTSSDSRVEAQNQIRIVADTGMIKLGPNQVLRVIMKDGSNNMTLENYAFRRIEYTQDDCNGGVCRHTISSQSQTAPITLALGEALSFNVGPDVQGNGVRAAVLSNSRNVLVTAAIINTLTGQTTSHIIVANTDGDIH